MVPTSLPPGPPSAVVHPAAAQNWVELAHRVSQGHTVENRHRRSRLRSVFPSPFSIGFQMVLKLYRISVSRNILNVRSKSRISKSQVDLIHFQPIFQHNPKKYDPKSKNSVAEQQGRSTSRLYQIKIQVAQL